MKSTVPTQKARRVNLYEEHAREKAGMPPEWQLFRWECFPKTADPGEFLYVEVTGAVALQKFTKGRRKGQPNWGKSSSRKLVVLPCADHEQWCAAWEQSTGKCQECVGTGEVFAGWSVDSGVRFRPCRKCTATGKAPSVVSASTALDANGVSSEKSSSSPLHITGD